jgi:hypothetical protein
MNFSRLSPDDPTIEEVIVEDVEHETFLAVNSPVGDGVIVLSIGPLADLNRAGYLPGSCSITVRVADLLDALKQQGEL